MDPLKSEINAAEARIKQIEQSELFSDTEREKLLPGLRQKLEELLQKADKTLDIEVIQVNEIADFPSQETVDSCKTIWQEKGRNRNPGGPEYS